MFGFYEDPFFWGYRPRQYYYYTPRQSFMDRYLANVERRLAEMLDEELDYPGYSIDIDRRARALQQQMNKDAQDHSEAHEKAKAEAKAQYNDPKDEAAAPPKPAPQRQPRRLPFGNYFYESRSSYNGHDFVEEHRERVTGEDGVVHTTMRRRLGDRWYENETHTDKEGKSTSKETWHNVPEDQIEAFKKEWSEKHGQKYEAIASDAPATPAVEHKPEEEKKE